MPEGGAQQEFLVVRQDWGYGPPDEKAKVFGTDIATLENGKIKVLYAIIEPPS
jgi:hypothetical protein